MSSGRWATFFPYILIPHLASGWPTPPALSIPYHTVGAPRGRGQTEHFLLFQSAIGSFSSSGYQQDGMGRRIALRLYGCSSKYLHIRRVREFDSRDRALMKNRVHGLRQRAWADLRDITFCEQM